MTTMTTTKDTDGKITVAIQRQDFARAITAIAESNLWLAKALVQGHPHISVSNCNIVNSAGAPAISIESFDDSMVKEEKTVPKIED